MKFLLALVSALGVTAQQSPVLSPANPSVPVGASITLNSSVPVTWSLAGSGSIKNQTSTSVTYIAPSSVDQPTIQGCPALPSDSVFSTRVDNLPIHSFSSTWLSTSGPQPNASPIGITFLTAWGITHADASTPKVNITPYYGDNFGSNPSYLTPFPGRLKVARENGSFNGNATANDHHTVVLDSSTCTYYEYYNELIGGLDEADFTTFEPCRYIGLTCNAASEIPPYSATSYTMPTTSTDAAGLPLAPLTWTLADIKSGPKHAVRFTTARGYINNAQFLWPAIQANGWNSSAAPYGSRWRLRTAANGGPNIPGICGTNSDCINLLTALTLYGMVEADIGAANQIQVADDAVSDPSVRTAMNIIGQANIGPQAFDIIDESSLQEQGSSYQVPATGSYAVSPTNPYVTPQNYALLTATPLLGSPISLSIALEGIGIGLPSTTMSIAAGLSYQLISWVTPTTTSSQNVTWTLLSGAGSVTSTGVYTAPSQISQVTQAVLEASAEADPNVHALLYVNVLGTNAGTYSIDFNAPTQTVSPGKIWNTDFGIEASTANFFGVTNDYPAWFTSPGNPIPEFAQYDSVLYTYGGDIRFNAVVPNGNYLLRVMQGEPYDGNYPSIMIPESLDLANGPELIDINGSIVAHYYDWEAAVGYLFGTPQDIYVPATVTTNVLTIGIRTIVPDISITTASGIGPLYSGLYPYLIAAPGNPKGSLASGMEIIPDPLPPHWQIDCQGATIISPGENVQLYLVDWHTGFNDPTWSIIAGPPGSSITATGLLSLVATASPVGIPIEVLATDGLYSATVTIHLPSTPAPVLTWPAPTPITYGATLGNNELNATSNVGGTFTYTPPPGTVLTVGTHILTAIFTPTGGGAAVSTSTTLQVIPAKPSITWTQPNPIIWGTALGPLQLDAQSTVPGQFVYSPAAGTILPEGIHELMVTFIPDDALNYSSVQSVMPIEVEVFRNRRH